MYKGRTTFKAVTGRYVWTGLLALGFPAVAFLVYWRDGITWIFLSFVVFSVVGILGFVETATSYIVLDHSQLRMRRTFRGYTVRKEEIESVSREKGCPTLLIKRDGGKMEIPDLGVVGVDNSIRAWLRAA